jgi:hypothetical protein
MNKEVVKYTTEDEAESLQIAMELLQRRGLILTKMTGREIIQMAVKIVIDDTEKILSNRYAKA